MKYLPSSSEHPLDPRLCAVERQIAIMESQKPIHTVVLDTGSIIKNEPSVSTLLKHSESLVTVPEIISEIRDAATRSRVDTTLRPFLTLRSPNAASIKFVTDFARRTGDLSVLSRPDLLIIALTYELECERNGGDWRLRNAPGQKRINGSPPQKDAENSSPTSNGDSAQVSATAAPPTINADGAALVPNQASTPETTSDKDINIESNETVYNDNALEDISAQLSSAVITSEKESDSSPKVDSTQNSAGSQEESDSDSGGWIAPSNLKKKQAQDAGSTTSQAAEPKTIQVGVLTTDFAMQNVIMQINLNLLSPQLTRVKNLKTFVLRCHSCFQVCKDMSKQFCPRCGQPTLTRVTCSTGGNGEFKLHLKKNMQWNNRGDRYSIPKPVHGSSNGRVKGGGKGSWGNELILAEDQKEYQRAVTEEKRSKARDLMDEDYLPSILTGDRHRSGGRVKVGAGRNINSRKR